MQNLHSKEGGWRILHFVKQVFVVLDLPPCMYVGLWFGG
jgi:hypothetical protein